MKTVGIPTFYTIWPGKSIKSWCVEMAWCRWFEMALCNTGLVLNHVIVRNIGCTIWFIDTRRCNIFIFVKCTETILKMYQIFGCIYRLPWPLESGLGIDNEHYLQARALLIAMCWANTSSRTPTFAVILVICSKLTRSSWNL